jgi:hypothetical protein
MSLIISFKCKFPNLLANKECSRELKVGLVEHYSKVLHIIFGMQYQKGYISNKQSIHGNWIWIPY